MHVVQEENNIEKKIEFSLHVYKTNMKCNINNLRDNTTGKKRTCETSGQFISIVMD